MNHSEQSMAAKSGQFKIGGELTINRLGYGALHLTGPSAWGEPKDRTQVIKVLHRAIDLGINFIDTADAYGPGVSESIIAEALYPYPQDLIIATKAGFLRPRSGDWIANGTPSHLLSACDDSLRRLKVERIDLYQLHSIDPNVPLEDQVGALVELQQQGKILHIGLSNVDVEQIKAAQRVAKIATVQNRYSIVFRKSQEVVAYCEQQDIGFIPWFPLETGQLSQNDFLSKLATQLNVTSSQLALAWLLKKSPIMLPIPGTSQIKHLEENIASVTIQLDEHAMNMLENYHID